MRCSYSYDEDTGKEGERETDKIPSSDDEMMLEELQQLEHVNVLEVALQSVSGLEKLFNTRKLLKTTQFLCLPSFKGPERVDVSLLAKTEHLDGRCDFKELTVDSTLGNGGLHKSAVLTNRSFNSITRVMVRYCDFLEDLTCLVLMPNLRSLVVAYCQRLRAIVSEEKLVEIVRDGKDAHPFSHLSIMRIGYLPKVESIYPSSLPLRFLYQFNTRGCPLLKKLPLGSNSVVGCRIQLRADEDWWNAIEWEDDAAKAALLPRLKLLFSWDYRMMFG